MRKNSVIRSRSQHFACIMITRPRYFLINLLISLYCKTQYTLCSYVQESICAKTYFTIYLIYAICLNIHDSFSWYLKIDSYYKEIDELIISWILEETHINLFIHAATKDIIICLNCVILDNAYNLRFIRIKMLQKLRWKRNIYGM